MSLNFLTLTKEELYLILAGFILGIILGMGVFNFIVGQQLDRLIYEKKELESKVKSQKIQLEKLEKSLVKHRKIIVKNIDIEVDSELDKHLNQEIKNTVFKLLENLIGEDLSKINPNFIVNSLEQRIVIIEENAYQLNLLWFIIHPQTEIKIEAIKKEKA